MLNILIKVGKHKPHDGVSTNEATTHEVDWKTENTTEVKSATVTFGYVITYGNGASQACPRSIVVRPPNGIGNFSDNRELPRLRGTVEAMQIIFV